MFQFLRVGPVDILRYLPKELAKDTIFKNTGEICSGQHEKIRLKLIDVARQFFAETATWGLTDWERVLGIDTVRGDGYDTRRNRVLLKLLGTQTSTMEFMDDLINRYTTYRNGYIIEHNNKYKFEIVANADSVEDWHELFVAIKTYKPAHLMMFMAIEMFLQQEIRQRAEITQIVDVHHNPYNKGTAELVRYNRKHRLNESFYYSGVYPMDAAYRTRQVQYQDCTQSTNCVHIFKPINRVILNSRCNVNIAYKPSLYAVGSCIADSKQKIKMLPTVKETSVVDCEYTSNDEPRETNAYNRKFAYNGLHTYSKSKINTGLLDNICTIIITKNGRKVGAERA